MLKKRHQTIIVSLLFILVVSGCRTANTTFNPPTLNDLPKSELAIIWIKQDFNAGFPDNIMSVYIDGATTPIETNGFWDWHKIYVLPGTHEIKFTCRRMITDPLRQGKYETGTGTVSFEARAGVWYHLAHTSGLNEATKEDLRKHVFYCTNPFDSVAQKTDSVKQAQSVETNESNEDLNASEMRASREERKVSAKPIVEWKEIVEVGVLPLHTASELGNADDVKQLLDTGGQMLMKPRMKMVLPRYI